jgi:hypothetical protein
VRSSPANGDANPIFRKLAHLAPKTPSRMMSFC